MNKKTETDKCKNIFLLIKKVSKEVTKGDKDRVVKDKVQRALISWTAVLSANY